MSDNVQATILVLGSQGNLGSQIVAQLKNQTNSHVIAWTRKECDVTDFCLVEEGIRKIKPSVVINTVAYNAVDACELDLKEQHKAIKLNVQLVECLAQTCKDINAKLIQFSTNYVFSGEESSYTEFDSPNPINFYGLSKQLTEEVVTTKIKSGLSAAIIRVSNLFGPCGTGASSKPSFFDAIRKAAEGKEFINVVNDEMCCFTYTKDIATRLAEVIDDEEFSGIYNFVNSNPVTWYEGAKLYFKMIGKEVVVKPISGDVFKRAAKRPESAVLKMTRIKPLRSFEEAMSEYISEFPPLDI